MRELILEKLKVSGYLPPLPDVLIALQKLMNDPDCDVEDVRRLISSDPVISSRIITMANNVLFGGGRATWHKILRMPLCVWESGQCWSYVIRWNFPIALRYRKHLGKPGIGSTA